MKHPKISALICGGALALPLSVAPAWAAPAPNDAPMPATAMMANAMTPVNVLASTQWQLTSPNYAGLKDRPTLRFNDARLSASVGLNRLGGNYNINGARIEIPSLFSTKMVGPPNQMRAENQYSRALEGVRSYDISRDGRTLSLRGAQVLTFERIGKTLNDPLAATQWQLDSPKYAGLNQKPTLQFSENRLNASVGLNQINGEYRVNDSKLAVSPLASTRMAGPPPVMTAEDQYSRALQNARNFELSSDGQTLTLRGDATLSFSRVGQTMNNDALASTQWNLTSPAYAGLEKQPVLRFEDGRANASVGLNQIGGAYQTNGKNISFGSLLSTRMAGSPAQMAAESRYARALATIRTFEVSRDGKILSLRGAEVLTFERAGQTMNNPLASTQWQLAEPTYAGAAKTPTLTFEKDSLGATVGLNGMGAGYKVEGNEIKLEQFISTMMAGPPALMDAENAYKKALGAVRTFEIAPDGKTLTLRGDTTLKFISQSALPQGTMPQGAVTQSAVPQSPVTQGAVTQGFVATETKIISVDPQLGPEFVGDKTPKYLQLEDLSEGANWGRFTLARILGFEHQPGNRYQLRVQVERDAQTDAEQLRLLEVFSQQYVAAAPLGADDKVLEVAPTKVDCVGVAPMKCLQVREVGGQWRNFYSPIEGFDFVEGSRYRLQVKVSQIANPPADGSSLRYQLVRVLDKMPVTY